MDIGRDNIFNCTFFYLSENLHILKVLHFFILSSELFGKIHCDLKMQFQVESSPHEPRVYVNINFDNSNQNLNLEFMSILILIILINTGSCTGHFYLTTPEGYHHHHHQSDRDLDGHLYSTPLLRSVTSR